MDPSRADELFHILSRATRDGMRHREGFVSATLHVSPDRRHVTNHAQWRSRSDVDAMMADPEARRHMADAAQVAASFSPIYYEVVETFASTDPA